MAFKKGEGFFSPKELMNTYVLHSALQFIWVNWYDESVYARCILLITFQCKHLHNYPHMQTHPHTDHESVKQSQRKWSQMMKWSHIRHTDASLLHPDHCSPQWALHSSLVFCLNLNNTGFYTKFILIKYMINNKWVGIGIIMGWHYLTLLFICTFSFFG